MSETPPNDPATQPYAADAEVTQQGQCLKRSYYPWVVVIVVALLLAGLHLFDSALAEAVNLDPGVKHLSTFALPMVAVFLISVWYLFRHRKSPGLGMLIALIGAVSPFAFLLLYQPVFGGNANIVGFEPRYWGREREIVSEVAEVSTSPLAETSKYDFPQFLGPNRSGKVNSVSLDAWDETQPELLWKQPVGEAWSGFVAVNGFAITQEQRGELECVICYEIETGKVVWNYSVERRHEDYRGFGRVGPRATPTIHDGKVYAVSGTGVLDCLNGEDGSLVWSYDVPAKVGIDQSAYTNSRGFNFIQENSTLIWGRASSPLIVDDQLIIPGGGMFDAEKNPINELAATLIALDPKTGEEIWRGGKRMIAYGSPSVATVAGKKQILLTAEDHAVGHDPETGEELWAFPWPGDSSAAANCSQVTFIDENQILISKGYATGGQIIKLNKVEGGELEAVAGKADPRALKTKLSNPVVLGEHAYAISDRFLECVELATLKRVWRKRGYGTGQLLLVGDKLLVHSEDGELSLVSARPDEFEQLGEIKTVEGTCWNTLCIYKDLVLVRSEQEAACFRVPISEVPNEEVSIGD